jgi:hypothetical protein
MFSCPTTTGIAERVWDREFIEKAKRGRLWRYVAFSWQVARVMHLVAKDGELRHRPRRQQRLSHQQIRVVEHKG